MNPKLNTYLAIEFASSCIKFVKMTQQGEVFELLEAKTIPMTENNNIQAQEKLYREAVQNLFSSEDEKNSIILVSINSLHTWFSNFVLPKLRHKEIAETLKWKVKDEIPFSLEEAALDYRLLDINVDHQPQILVLVAATQKELIHSYSKFLPEPKLKPYLYPTVCFAIDHLTQSFSPSKEDSVAVVDLGHSVAEIAIYLSKKLIFLRKVAFGSHSLKQAMMQPFASERGTVSLNIEEAENALHTENLFDQNDHTLLANKIELSQLHSLIRPEFEKLAEEINRSLDYFRQQHGKNVSQIYLTGGLSRLKGLPEFLFQKLQTQVQILDLSKSLKIQHSPDQNLNFFYRPISFILDRATSSTSKLEFSLDRPIESMTLRKALAILISIWLVLTCSLAWRYYETNQKQKMIVSEINNLKIGFEEAKKIKQLQTQNRKGEMFKAKILEPEPNWEEVFRELSNVFPGNVVLRDVSFNQKILTVNGMFKTGDENAVSELLISLEGPIFKNVTLVNVEKREETTEFSIRTEVI